MEEYLEDEVINPVHIYLLRMQNILTSQLDFSLSLAWSWSHAQNLEIQEPTLTSSTEYVCELAIANRPNTGT